ncbi:hypothetical protein V6C39_19260 [Dickeya ananatis]
MPSNSSTPCCSNMVCRRALRARGQDIALLAGFFCERSRARLGLQRLSLSPQATQLLVRYPWPGNVRELEHVIYRATIVARAGGTSGDLVLRSEHLNLDGVLPDVPHPANAENTAPPWRQPAGCHGALSTTGD